MSSHVFLEITPSSEHFGTVFKLTIERVPIMESHMSVQTIERSEGVQTPVHLTDEWFFFGVNSDMNFQAVGGQEGFIAILHLAFELVIPSMGLLMGAQIPLSSVSPSTARKVAHMSLWVCRSQMVHILVPCGEVIVFPIFFFFFLIVLVVVIPSVLLVKFILTFFPLDLQHFITA